MLRASVSKLLQNIQDETSKTDVNHDRLHEMLPMLTQKEKSVQEIQPNIENEIPLEELEVDVVRSIDY